VGPRIVPSFRQYSLSIVGKAVSRKELFPPLNFYPFPFIKRCETYPVKKIFVSRASAGNNGGGFSDHHSSLSSDEHKNNFYEIKVEGVKVLQGSSIVYFRVLDGKNSTFPIHIGETESVSLLRELNHQRQVRPSTSDLMKNIITSLSYKTVKVQITDMVANTYYARLYLARVTENGEIVPGSEIDVDARPSDAINLAVRFRAPIYISDVVASSAITRVVDSSSVPYSLTNNNNNNNNNNIRLNDSSTTPSGPSASNNLNNHSSVNFAAPTTGSLGYGGSSSGGESSGSNVNNSSNNNNSNNNSSSNINNPRSSDRSDGGFSDSSGQNNIHGIGGAYNSGGGHFGSSHHSGSKSTSKHNHNMNSSNNSGGINGSSGSKNSYNDNNNSGNINININRKNSSYHSHSGTSGSLNGVAGYSGFSFGSEIQEADVAQRIRDTISQFEDPTLFLQLQKELAVAEERFEDARKYHSAIVEEMTSNPLLRMAAAAEVALMDGRLSEASDIRDDFQAELEAQRHRRVQDQGDGERKDEGWSG